MQFALQWLFNAPFGDRSLEGFCKHRAAVYFYSVALVTTDSWAHSSMLLAFNPVADASFAVEIDSTAKAIRFEVVIFTFVYTMLILKPDDAITIPVGVQLANNHWIWFTLSNGLISIYHTFCIIKYLWNLNRPQIIPHLLRFKHVTFAKRFFVKNSLKVFWELCWFTVDQWDRYFRGELNAYVQTLLIFRLRRKPFKHSWDLLSTMTARTRRMQVCKLFMLLARWRF